MDLAEKLQAALQLSFEDEAARETWLLPMPTIWVLTRLLQ
jgi:hypothetical protein